MTLVEINGETLQGLSYQEVMAKAQHAQQVIKHCYVLRPALLRTAGSQARARALLHVTPPPV